MLFAHAGHGVTSPGHLIHVFEPAHGVPLAIALALAAAWALNELRVPREWRRS